MKMGEQRCGRVPSCKSGDNRLVDGSVLQVERAVVLGTEFTFVGSGESLRSLVGRHQCSAGLLGWPRESKRRRVERTQIRDHRIVVPG